MPMAMDVEAEIRDLKRRVDELEGSFGFLSRQVQGVHRDLLAFEEKTERKLREHDARFDQVNAKVDGLRRDLPGIVGDTMREVLNETRKR
jgi:hypothetical protein